MVFRAPSRRPRRRARALDFTPGKLGKWLFLGSDAMGFMGLIGLYMVLHIRSADWQVPEGDPGFGIRVTAVITFILIVSSLTMVTALDRIQTSNAKGLLFWRGITVLGRLTLLGLEAYQWTHFIHDGDHLATRYAAANKGQLPPLTSYQGTFFLRTGFHGLHGPSASSTRGASGSAASRCLQRGHAHAPYRKILAWLTVLTIGEIACASIPNRPVLIAGLSVMAAAKAALVGLYYMRLKYGGEAPLGRHHVPPRARGDHGQLLLAKRDRVLLVAQGSKTERTVEESRCLHLGVVHEKLCEDPFPQFIPCAPSTVEYGSQSIDIGQLPCVRDTHPPASGVRFHRLA